MGSSATPVSSPALQQNCRSLSCPTSPVDPTNLSFLIPPLSPCFVPASNFSRYHLLTQGLLLPGQQVGHTSPLLLQFQRCSKSLLHLQFLSNPFPK